MKYSFMHPSINGYTTFDEQYVSAIRPTDDVCLITEIIPLQGKSIIVRPDTATVVRYLGFVHSVGPKVEALTANIVVAFSKYSGLECQHERDKYLFIRENEIVAVYDPTANDAKFEVTP